jgi:hypothetical protein
MPQEPIWRWFFGAIALGLLLAVIDVAGRSVQAIRQYGLRLWVRSLFQMEIESLKMLTVVLILLAALIIHSIRKAG